jgi:hypothetical protein
MEGLDEMVAEVSAEAFSSIEQFYDLVGRRSFGGSGPTSTRAGRQFDSRSGSVVAGPAHGRRTRVDGATSRTCSSRAIGTR